MTPMELLDYATRLAGFDAVPADSCVVHDAGRPIRKVLTSINATTGDLALAKSLGCDTYLLHHPLAGAARRDFHRVIDRMVELMCEEGVNKAIAGDAVADLRRRLRFNDHASDWDHLVSGAQLLDINLLNVHLPADELGRRIMRAALEDLPLDATLADVATALRTIPELAHPANEFILIPNDPTSPDAPAGRVAVMHAGGTNGGYSVASTLFDHTTSDPRGPVGTVLYIHCSGDDAKRLEDRADKGGAGTVLITGHLASDAIGMNALIRSIATDHPDIEVISHGGLRPFAP